MNTKRLVAGFLTGIALLALSAPAVSQDAAEPASSEAQAGAAAAVSPEEISEEEAAFNRRSAAMAERVQAYDAEFKTVARELSADSEARRVHLDDIQARFQAEIDVFVQDFIDFAVLKEAVLSNEERQRQRDGVLAMVPLLGSLPASLRQLAEAGGAASGASTPVDPET